MRKSSLVLLALLLAAGGAVAAIQTTTATPAYQAAFGHPPKTEGQSCTAAVVFFPGIGASGSRKRLSPLPVFLLNRERVPEDAARVAIQGYPTEVREFRVPSSFPRGTKLKKFKASRGTATVDVASGGGAAASALAYQALAHTLEQFGLKSVILRVEGRPAMGPLPLQQIVEPPPPVRLLDVVAPVRRGEKPSEIDVLFDRPLTVSSFTIGRTDGTAVRGTSYLSMFDMAIVFKPVDPTVIAAGTPLSVSWSVQDKSGRAAEGTRSVALRIYEAP